MTPLFRTSLFYGDEKVHVYGILSDLYLLIFLKHFCLTLPETFSRLYLKSICILHAEYQTAKMSAPGE